MSNAKPKGIPITHKHNWLQALQLTPENIEEMEAFVNGDQKGTKLDRKDREVEFWDNFAYGGQEQRIRMTDWAVKYPNGYIHVVTADTFTVLYKYWKA